MGEGAEGQVMHRYEEDGIDALGWLLKILLKLLVMIWLAVFVLWMGWL